MARAAAAKRKAAPKSAGKTEAISITLPALAKGEEHGGLILEKGKPSHFVVLLPGEGENLTFAQAKEFAKKAGGELPTRAEQSLLFANAKEHFQPRWYWSGEQPAGESDYAWCQGFDYGYQHWGHVSATYRARAVRRVPVQ